MDLLALLIPVLLPSFQQPQVGPQQPGPLVPSGRIARGDLDGDGIDELLIVHRSGLTLLMGQASGGFAPCTPGTLPSVGGRAAAWRDVDGDGDLDLLVWGADAGHLLVNEHGLLRDASVESGFGSSAGIVDAIQWTDLDGDGLEDVLLFTAGRVVARRNLGQARFEPLELGLPEGAVSGVPTFDASPAATGPTSPVIEPSGDGTEPSTLPALGHGSGPRTRRTPVAAPNGAPASPASPSSAGLQFGGFCAARIHDALGGACLQASATPTLGMLLPLSTDFNVDAAGNVGIGTTAQSQKLEVIGNVRATGQLRSDIVGQPPLRVQSSALVPSLNADLLDGKHASQFTQLGSSIEGSEVTDGTLVDADLSASAAIAGTKVTPSFGAQDVSTRGSLAVGTTTPIGLAHLQSQDLGVTAGQLWGEALTVEAADAYVALVGDSLGQFGSGLTLREVAAGALTDVWSMLRETNGSGSDLLFTYGSNRVPYLNRGVLTLSSSGDVGIGTSSPSIPLEVHGGTDATPRGGGFAQLGPTTGRNIVLDDNEIMARDNGNPSTLYLNNEGGNVSILGNVPGNVGIGVFAPTARLEVAGPTGTGTVVLPTSSIDAIEVQDEPGVASKSLSLGPDIPISLTPVTLLTCQLTAPTDGYVLATGHVSVTSKSSSGPNQTTLSLGLGGGGSYGKVVFDQQAREIVAASTTHIFPVSAGLNTVYLQGRNSSANSVGASATSYLELALVFFPTAYGLVQ